MQINKPKLTIKDYLQSMGVKDLPARTSPFDPGYDPCTLESHLKQSAHLISILKVSMACWQVADEKATRQKVAAAKNVNVETCTGGGPFEVAATFNKLAEYMDLCADIGFTRIEAGEGFTNTNLKPNEIIKMATERGLDVQYEVGEKHGGSFSFTFVSQLLDESKLWLDAGAKQIVVEGRESAMEVGLFSDSGEFDAELADRFVETFGFETIIFEAPNKLSQFAMLNHFGPEVHLSNVRIEELLRVEIYRRGIHSDAFQHKKLRPAGPA